jgi:hypothetical protein
MAKSTNTPVPLSNGHTLVVRYAVEDNFGNLAGIEIFVEEVDHAKAQGQAPHADPTEDRAIRHPTKAEWSEARERVHKILDRYYGTKE